MLNLLTPALIAGMTAMLSYGLSAALHEAVTLTKGESSTFAAIVPVCPSHAIC